MAGQLENSPECFTCACTETVFYYFKPIPGNHVKEPLHPDFVPTIFPHRTVADPNQKLNRYKHARKREQTSSLHKRKVAKTTAVTVSPDLPTSKLNDMHSLRLY